MGKCFGMDRKCWKPLLILGRPFTHLHEERKKDKGAKSLVLFCIFSSLVPAHVFSLLLLLFLFPVLLRRLLLFLPRSAASSHNLRNACAMRVLFPGHVVSGLHVYRLPHNNHVMLLGTSDGHSFR